MDNEESKIVEVEGTGAVVTLYAHKVSIERKGVVSFFTHGSASQKDIWIESIISIDFKKPNLASNGYIRFVSAGDSKVLISSPANEGSAVWFRRGKLLEFTELKERVEQLILASRESSLGSHTGAGVSVADELGKLAELRDRGTITEDQFEVQRSRILGE